MKSFKTVVLTTFLLTVPTLADSSEKILKKEPIAYCKIAPLFGAKGQQKPIKYEDKKFCKSITRTCCSSDDFILLQKWWEDSFSQMSLVEKRAIEMRTLLGRFKLLLDYKDEIQVRVDRIKKMKKSGQPACTSPAHVMGNILRLGLLETAVNHYEKSAKKCWGFTKDMINGLMCAACDADAQDEIIKDKSKITISTHECTLFTDNCLDHLRSLWALTHYLTFMNFLASCDDKAEFKGTTETMMMDSNLIQAINSCLHEKNIDDCMQVCRSQISFSTQVAFEHNNIGKILTFLRNVEEDFGELAAKKRKEKEAKEKKDDKKKKVDPKKKDDKKTEKKMRVLADGDKKKTEDENSEEKIVSYGTLVKLKGLNLTRYTVNNTDNFESLNINNFLFPESEVAWSLKFAVALLGFIAINIIS